ncbi:MAG TPA: PaaI family thioesterase [Acidimicrobiales bacterium]|nr:PaaI family thioesterase [Acidimicrobiales bacterium]
MDPASGYYRSSLAAAMDPPADARAAVRLGSALRRAARLATASAAPPELLDRVADEVERLAELLAPHAETSRYPHAERLGSPGGGFLTHPFTGAVNPASPPLRLSPEGETLVGSVAWGPQFEGPPGFAHGGHISGCFDVLLTATAGINGRGGLTRSLAVRYRRPAPLDTELRYEAAVDSFDGRTTVVRGRLTDGDQLCAEATAEIATGRGPAVPAPTA